MKLIRYWNPLLSCLYKFCRVNIKKVDKNSKERIEIKIQYHF